MAGSGNLGDLYLSLDIKSNLAKELSSYTQKIDDLETTIKNLQKSVNVASSDLNKMAKGSDAWEKQRESIRRNIKEIDELYRKWELYKRELSAVQQRAENVAKGGLVGKGFSITSLLDTKPIEQQITKLEKVVQLQEKLQSIQSQRPGNVMDFLFSDRAGNKNYRAYSAAVETYRNQVTDVMSQLKAIGGENIGIADAKRQLESLYSTLARFEQSNQRATSSVRDSRSELDKHAAKQKEVEIAFQGVMAAQRREAQQEAANRANIEATNAARQRQVEVLRQQSEALMRNKLSTLESQRSQMAGLYSRGRSVGLDAAELENIRQRYREISQEILNMQSMLQHAKGLPYNDMFASGRTVGSGGAFIRDAAGQIARVRQETLDATRAARDLASAFNQVHRSASQSSQVLGDIKSMFLQGGIVYGAQRFANAIVQTGGDIVQQHIALRSIIGDIQKADTLFAQIQQLALQSPFKFGELNRDVKQLAAFGVEADRLFDTAKRLADVAAGLGVSFERLGLAYGQTKARSWLDGKELRQFAYAGIPMLQRIAELYNDTNKGGRNNYTAGEIKNMITKRLVSFEDVDAVFKRMTDEGGQFYNLQFVLSETLLGRWNKLIDAWDIMLGKMADGKNVVSQVFMGGLNAATEFVLQLDKISPILLSFGGMYAGKRLFGGLFGSMGTGGLLLEMKTAQMYALKTFSAAQMQEVVEGKITTEKAQQNILERQKLLNTTSVKGMTYMQLAAEGRISAFQLGQLARRGEISAELVSQLRIMGVINAKEAELIALLRTEGLSRTQAFKAQAQLDAVGIGGKIGGLMSVSNIAMAGAAVGMALWMGYSQFYNRVKEREKALKDSARQHFDAYNDVLKNVSQKGDGGISRQVESMKEVLTSSGDYTDTIKAQVENAKTLSDQYDILKTKIESLRDSNNKLSGFYGSAVSNAMTATGTSKDFLLESFGIDTPEWMQWTNGLFDDDIEKNVEEAMQSIQKYQFMFDQVDKNTQASMGRFIQMLASKNKELANSIKGLPIAEQVRVLAYTGGDDWDAFVERFSNGSSEVASWLKNMQKAAKESSSDVSEIMYDDVPKLLESLREQLGMSQNQFKAWAAKNPEVFAKMMDTMTAKAGVSSKEILYYFQSTVSKLMGMNFWSSPFTQGKGKGSRPIYRSGIVSGTLAGDIRANLRSRGIMSVGKNVGEYDKILREVQDDSFTKTAENIRNLYKTKRNELDQIDSEVSKNQIVSKGTIARQRSLRHQLSQIIEIANAGAISLDVGKNKTTGHFGKNGSRTGVDKDTALEAVRDRVEIYKKFFREYESLSKILGDNAALGNLKTSNDFGSVFGFGLSDVTNFSNSLDQLTSSLSRTTEERRKFLNDTDAEKAAKARQDLEQKIKDNVSDLNYELEVMKAGYDIYKKIVSVTGDKDLANRVAFSGASVSTPKELLRSQMARQFGGDTAKADATLAMSRDEINSKYGINSAIGSIWEKNLDNIKESQKESKELYVEILTKHQTLQDQIDAENSLYEQQIELLQKNKDLTPEQYDKAKTSLDTDHAQKLGDIRFQQFKQDSGWEQIFRDLDRVSVKSIDKLLSGLRTLLSTNDMSVEDTKAVIEAIDKLMERREEASPFSSIANGYGTLRTIQRIRNAGTNANGNYTLTGDQEKALGLGKTPNGEHTENDLNDAEANVFKGFENSVKGIQKAFDGLQAVLSPVAELFDALGSSGLSDALNIGGKALGSASSAIGGMSSLKSLAGDKSGLGKFLGKAGPYAAAAAAALSVATSIFALHDKALQKEIEASQQRQKEMENLSKNVETQLNRILGGIYNFRAPESTVSLLKDYLGKYMIANNGKNDVQSYIIGRQYSYIQETTANAIKEALSQGGNFYDTTYASMLAQRDELVRQQQLEEDKKKTDSGKVADYKQQILELQDQIDYFAEDMAKKLYDIDIQSWAKDLSDAVVEAWENGENAADAYGEKVKEILNNTLKSIVAKSIMENALKPTLEFVKKTMNDNNGILNEDSIETIADLLGKAGETAVNGITKVFDKMKKKGYDFSPTSSKSLSSGIKSITEDTADILASYVNAIRLDVSVDRANIQLIADAASKLPTMSVIAKSQLTALESISQNTLRNADAADQMLSLFKAITNGTKKVYMN